MAFHYTLDSDNISYEETIRMIANAVFCIAYRQNGKIRFSFDKPQTAKGIIYSQKQKNLLVMLLAEDSGLMMSMTGLS